MSANIASTTEMQIIHILSNSHNDILGIFDDLKTAEDYSDEIHARFPYIDDLRLYHYHTNWTLTPHNIDYINKENSLKWQPPEISSKSTVGQKLEFSSQLAVVILLLFLTLLNGKNLVDQSRMLLEVIRSHRTQ